MLCMITYIKMINTYTLQLKYNFKKPLNRSCLPAVIKSSACKGKVFGIIITLIIIAHPNKHTKNNIGYQKRRLRREKLQGKTGVTSQMISTLKYHSMICMRRTLIRGIKIVTVNSDTRKKHSSTHLFKGGRTSKLKEDQCRWRVIPP